MTDPKQDDYVPSAGVMYALAGIALLALAGIALANTNEGGVFGVLGLVLVGSGCYCIVVGGVARGIQLSRK